MTEILLKRTYNRKSSIHPGCVVLAQLGYVGRFCLILGVCGFGQVYFLCVWGVQIEGDWLKVEFCFDKVTKVLLCI